MPIAECVRCAVESQYFPNRSINWSDYINHSKVRAIWWIRSAQMRVDGDDFVTCHGRQSSKGHKKLIQWPFSPIYLIFFLLFCGDLYQSIDAIERARARAWINKVYCKLTSHSCTEWNWMNECVNFIIRMAKRQIAADRIWFIASFQILINWRIGTSMSAWCLLHTLCVSVCVFVARS